MASTDDIGDLMGQALQDLWDFTQDTATVDVDGESVVVLEWRAPGVEPGEHDELIAEALAALRDG